MKSRKLKNIMFSVVAIVGVALIATVSWFHFQKDRFGTFSNYNEGYAIDYPLDWTFSEGYMQTSVMFFSKQETAMDTFKENVSVNIQNLEENPKTLSEYTQEALSQMDSIFADTMTVLESAPITVAGIPAYKYVIIAHNANQDIQLLFVWTIDGARAYQMTFTALTSSYERYYEKFERMFESFRFLR